MQIRPSKPSRAIPRKVSHKTSGNTSPAAPAMERSTRQKAAIRAAIEQAQRPLSPQEVLTASQADVPALGMATVYRNLKLLLEAGEIIAVNLPGDSARYEASRQAHHHHFQCTACERVFDVHECPGDLARLAPQGFTVEHHELTLYGRCSECPPPRAAGRRAPHRHTP